MPATGPRRPLTLQLIGSTAVAVADTEGLANTTMRRIARELQCEAMSLYHHVADKSALRSAMLDLIFAEVKDDARLVREWREGITGIARSIHDTLVSHPWATELMHICEPGPERCRVMECMLARLRQGGFSANLLDHAYHAVYLHTVGYSAQYLELAQFSTTRQSAVSFDPVEYPELHAHAQFHVQSNPEPDSRLHEFEFILGLLLDGLERTRASSTTVAK